MEERRASSRTQLPRNTFKNKRDTPFQEYEVEQILGKKQLEGTTFYLIKWLNYPATENTWEPINHLQNLSAMLQAFDPLVKILPCTSELPTGKHSKTTRRFNKVRVKKRQHALLRAAVGSPAESTKIGLPSAKPAQKMGSSYCRQRGANQLLPENVTDVTLLLKKTLVRDRVAYHARKAKGAKKKNIYPAVLARTTPLKKVSITGLHKYCLKALICIDTEGDEARFYSNSDTELEALRDWVIIGIIKARNRKTYWNIYEWVILGCPSDDYKLAPAISLVAFARQRPEIVASKQTQLVRTTTPCAEILTKLDSL